MVGMSRKARKAQVQTITLVLIGGIIISLVGIAYTWGKPMIDKRSVMSQFTSGRKFMEDLNGKIVDIAGTCSFEGGCGETLKLPFPGALSIDEGNNSITYELMVSEPLLTDEEILINTGNPGEHVHYGETPGVISLKGDREGSGLYTLRYELHYRELSRHDPARGYVIELAKDGTGKGTNGISVSYGRTETRSGEAHNGGDLVVSTIKVRPE